MKKQLFSDSDFLRNIFDAIPSPFFVVDDEVRILYRNSAAAAITGGEEIIMERGGDVLECIHSKESAEGCGHAGSCRDCVVRNSVGEAIRGKKVHRRKTRMTFERDGETEDIHYLVTTSPFRHGGRDYSLLILEDISELFELRNIVPICAWCRKIRDGENYWHSVEEYFGRYLELDFTHGMCEECSRKFIEPK
ncbi:MAG: PAS domain-containing protein [Nitrospiraceae bacterium]|nr:PAS domain-containing protein [Nitrospiraceae bacterium]